MHKFPWQYEDDSDAPVLIVYCMAEDDPDEAIVFEKTACLAEEEDDVPFFDVALYNKDGRHVSIVISKEDAEVLGHLLLGDDDPLYATPIIDPDKLFDMASDEPPQVTKEMEDDGSKD